MSQAPLASASPGERVGTIPSELRERPQWVPWRYDEREGKQTKIPYNPARPGERASTTDPATWGTFEQAGAVEGMDGIGYVFADDDPFAGIDLDDCIDENGDLHPAAAEIVKQLDGYTELSPSRAGVHVLVRAELKGSRHRTSSTPWEGSFEVYDRARFFTVTGNGTGDIAERQDKLDALVARMLPSAERSAAPQTNAYVSVDDEQLLELARAAKNGVEFDALFGGQHGHPSASEADLALCNMLAFWTGGDAARIDHLFRFSGLMRDKWDERRGGSTYGAQTIEKAIAGCAEFYESGRHHAKRDHGHGPERDLPTITARSVQDFVEVDEPGVEALVGSADDALIPEGGDVMVYGDGGAGKTTLTIDLAFHLAAGDAWLGMPIKSAGRVLVLENEGPRPLFRRKLRRKLDGWTGSPLEGRLRIHDEPWGEFTFASEAWRVGLAQIVCEEKIDVLVVGPITRSGWDEAGTLQQVRDFVDLVADVRRKSGQLLTVVLVHHESKGGAVSGAWEGAVDTLLHVEARGNGHTCLKVQKARWSNTHHGTTLDLAWTDGEGFCIKGERDYHAEIEALLSDGLWRTAKEIGYKRDHPDKPGVGAGEDTVKEKLAERPAVYVQRKGNEVGRHANATVYGLRSALNADDADKVHGGDEEGVCTSASPLGDAEGEDAHTPT